ncbi:MAG: acylphosphatase [Rhodospirillaceae bacterium]|jgi:acylphosphatase|nr:acylphosphatase [Rhodospirillaceae bacterium]MBT4218434.1 acylphosphatase [Rhodospirillaceae bacterium]MBT7356196.1 acylphosphatase [Rhodospirillaceae bacterium]
MKSIHVRITGRVQGVWYRAWTCQQADIKGLSGWVRNRRDGSVEAVFSGDDADVDAMLALCREGPHLAVVDALALEPCDPTEDGFKSLPTA